MRPYWMGLVPTDLLMAVVASLLIVSCETAVGEYAISLPSWYARHLQSSSGKQPLKHVPRM